MEVDTSAFPISITSEILSLVPLLVRRGTITPFAFPNAQPWTARCRSLRPTSTPASARENGDRVRQSGNEVAESGEYCRQNIAAKVFDGVYVRLPVHGASQNNSEKD